jgi:hypothetical protein
MNAFERSITTGTNTPGEMAAAPYPTERLALYRALVAAVKRLSLEPLNAGPAGHEVRVLAVE